MQPTPLRRSFSRLFLMALALPLAACPPEETYTPGVRGRIHFANTDSGISKASVIYDYKSKNLKYVTGVI